MLPLILSTNLHTHAEAHALEVQNGKLKVVSPSMFLKYCDWDQHSLYNSIFYHLLDSEHEVEVSESFEITDTQVTLNSLGFVKVIDTKKLKSSLFFLSKTILLLLLDYPGDLNIQCVVTQHFAYISTKQYVGIHKSFFNLRFLT